MDCIYANLERLEGIEARILVDSGVPGGELQEFAQAQIAPLRLALETDAVALETDAVALETEAVALETATTSAIEYLDALTSANYIQALLIATSKEQIDMLIPVLNQDDVVDALITACKENRPDIVQKILSDERIVSDSNWWKAYGILLQLYPILGRTYYTPDDHPIKKEFLRVFRNAPFELFPQRTARPGYATHRLVKSIE